MAAPHVPPGDKFIGDANEGLVWVNAVRASLARRPVPPGPVGYDVNRAPEGGTTVAGQHFAGGQFIPGDVMARASPAEKVAVEGRPAGKPITIRDVTAAGAGVADAQGESGRPLVPPAGPDSLIVSPGLTPDELRLERDSQLHVREHYPALRDQYLARNAARDPRTGEIRSVTLNTDDWRELVPGYVGTNAFAIHEAASWMNNRLYREALNAMRGKGNNKFLVLAGGGGSGKGTAAPEVMPMDDYPIVLDQVSDRLQKLESKLDEAKNAGYEPTYVFVDRPPVDAAGGIVGRALALRRKGKVARTVNLDVGLRANLDSRRTALDLLKRRPDIDATVVDNRGGRFRRRLITDRDEAIQYLSERLAEDEALVAGGLRDAIRDDVITRTRAGEIPRDLADGFLGKGWDAPPPGAPPSPPATPRPSSGARPPPPFPRG